MQFKVIFALALATLAAAVPHADSSARANKVEPPFAVGTTIKANQCASGHLRCCKSVESPTAADVASHLPSGTSASDISGFVGLDCTSLADANKTCPNVRLCCTQIPNDDISLACNKVA